MARSSSKKECAGALRAIIVAGERYRHAVAAHFELGVSETSIISILCRAGEPLTPRDIADRLMVRSGTLTAMLDRLEQAGMVERLPHPTDRRGRLIALTDAGEQVILFSTEGLMASLTDGGVGLGWPELTTLLEALANQLDRSAGAVSSARDASADVAS